MTTKTKRPAWGCSPAIIKALDYIGSHQKTRIYPRLRSCPISMKTAQRLVNAKWAFWGSDFSIMLTWEGERRWLQRHPYSKAYGGLIRSKS